MLSQSEHDCVPVNLQGSTDEAVGKLLKVLLRLGAGIQ